MGSIMSDYPASLLEFQKRYPDEEACANYLFDLRWPEGFRCPQCGHGHAWKLRQKPWTYHCQSCQRQTSVKAGTIFHGSKLPLTVWFWAAWLMGSHSNGISALQLQKQLGLGSYKSAWLLCAKLRHAMIDPDRNPLKGMVEIDETSLNLRSRDDPPAGGQGRDLTGKMAVAGAVEIIDKAPGRIRLAPIKDYSAASLHAFIGANVAKGAIGKTDGWKGYLNTPDIVHDPHVVGSTAAHVLFPWIHRVFSNLKIWALGVYHGLRPKHLQSYLDEFVFRFNRRGTRPAAFRSLLRIASVRSHLTYKMLIGQEAGG